MNFIGQCHVPLQGNGLSKLCNKQKKQRNTEMQHTQPNGISSLELPGDRLLATFINQMVASTFELPSERLLRYDRGNARATRARVRIY